MQTTEEASSTGWIGGQRHAEDRLLTAETYLSDWGGSLHGTIRLRILRSLWRGSMSLPTRRACELVQEDWRWTGRERQAAVATRRLVAGGSSAPRRVSTIAVRITGSTPGLRPALPGQGPLSVLTGSDLLSGLVHLCTLGLVPPPPAAPPRPPASAPDSAPELTGLALCPSC